MKYIYLIFSLLLCLPNYIFSQNIQITFTVSGKYSTVDSITVKNNRSSEQKVLNTSDILYLNNEVSLSHIDDINNTSNICVSNNSICRIAIHQAIIKPTTFCVFNTIGNKIYESELSITDANQTIEIQNVPPGIYFTQLTEHSFQDNSKISDGTSSHNIQLKSGEEIITMNFELGDYFIFTAYKNNEELEIEKSIYSNEVITFNFPTQEFLSLLPVTNIKATQAEFHGSINTSNYTIISKGFEYKKKLDTHWTSIIVQSNFDPIIGSLIPNTEYEVRLFAIEQTGTTYYSSTIETFTTLKNNIIFNPNLTYNSITDIDNNLYKTIQIGSQTWMAENLMTSTLNDGTSLQEYTYTSSNNWEEETEPAVYWKYSDILNTNTFGGLYNWYAVSTQKLCPQGWHVPFDADWARLQYFLHENVGGKLKEIETANWHSPNTGATNESGFSALPNATMLQSNVFSDETIRSMYWSMNDFIENAGTFSLYYDESYSSISNQPKPNGNAIRCIKDEINGSIPFISITNYQAHSNYIQVYIKEYVGHEPIISMGIEYKEAVATDWIQIVVDNSTFGTYINDLLSNTNYEIRAFTQTSTGTFYSEITSCSTLEN